MTTIELSRTERTLLRLAAADALCWRDGVLLVVNDDLDLLGDDVRDVVVDLTHRGWLAEHPDEPVNRVSITADGERVMHGVDEFEFDTLDPMVNLWGIAAAVLIGLLLWVAVSGAVYVVWKGLS